MRAGRQHERHAVVGQLAAQPRHLRDALGVEPGERVVEQHQRAGGDQRRRDREPAQVAGRAGGRGQVGAAGQARALQRVRDAPFHGLLRPGRTVHAVSGLRTGHLGQRVAGGSGEVERDGDAGLRGGLRCAGRLAEDRDRAARGRGQAGEQPQQDGLARAVSTGQGVSTTGRDGHVHIVEDRAAARGAADTAQDDGVRRFGRIAPRPVIHDGGLH